MNRIKVKNNIIKDKVNKTKERGKYQPAVIIKTKIDSDKLNINTSKALKRIFLEVNGCTIT